MTLAQARQALSTVLIPIYGREEAESIIRIIQEDVLQIYSRHNNLNATLPNAQVVELENIIVRLSAGEPLQYVLGEADFFGYKFRVSPSVLIPRMETEELVDIALKITKKKPTATILDMCTGSGCIAITIAKKYPAAQVVATDISEDALKIAMENNEKLQTQVNFVIHDACSDEPLLPEIMWDIIVSNPPYIPFSEQNIMPTWVVKHEPHLALFVNNDEPFVFYQKIINFAANYLKPEGVLLMECNQYNAQGILTLPDVGNYFKEAEIIKDLSGNDRILKAIKR